MDAERAKPLLVLLSVPLALVAALAVGIMAWGGRPSTDVTEWQSFEVDGSEVRLTYFGGACQDDAWIESEESVERVVLTVMTSTDGDSCPAQLVSHTLTTTLNAPLGDRELVDGAS